MGVAWGGHFNVAFNNQDDFREGLVWFLAILALLGTENETEQWYPGYRLIAGAQLALNRFAGRVANMPSFADGVASIFDEDAATFRGKWASRAEKANQAKLGGFFFADTRFPSAL